MHTNVDVMLKFTPEKAFDGRRLINYMIHIFKVMSMDFCDSMCFVKPDCVRINLDKWVKKDEEEGPLFLLFSWDKCCIISKYSFQVKKGLWNIYKSETILGLIRAKLLTPISTNESQVKHQKYLYFLFSFLLKKNGNRFLDFNHCYVRTIDY